MIDLFGSAAAEAQPTFDVLRATLLGSTIPRKAICTLQTGYIAQTWHRAWPNCNGPTRGRTVAAKCVAADLLNVACVREIYHQRASMFECAIAYEARMVQRNGLMHCDRAAVGGSVVIRKGAVGDRSRGCGYGPTISVIDGREVPSEGATGNIDVGGAYGATVASAVLGEGAI